MLYILDHPIVAEKGLTEVVDPFDMLNQHEEVSFRFNSPSLAKIFSKELNLEIAACNKNLFIRPQDEVMICTITSGIPRIKGECKDCTFKYFLVNK